MKEIEEKNILRITLEHLNLSEKQSGSNVEKIYALLQCAMSIASKMNKAGDRFSFQFIDEAFSEVLMREGDFLNPEIMEGIQ